MLKHLALILLLAGGLSAQAQTPQPRPLYPDGKPNGDNGLKPENTVHDTTNLVMFNVSEPDYFLFLPDPQKATGQAIVICPGGGYGCVVYGYEGLDVARWMNEQGIAAAVLRYRMPNGHPEIPLSDVHEMFRTMRRNAEQWNIDPHNIGIIGFSAGGHLASTAATHFDEETRPDFAVLIYPVISMDEKVGHTGSRDNLIGPGYDPERIAYYSSELQVTPQTPRTFIALGTDDSVVPPRNSTIFYDALQANGVEAELHIYTDGEHGWGWKKDFRHRDEFDATLARWLKEK